MAEDEQDQPSGNPPPEPPEPSPDDGSYPEPTMDEFHGTDDTPTIWTSD